VAHLHCGQIDCRIQIHNGSAITQVKEQDNHVLVENALGEQYIFDRVIVATPTNKIEDFLNTEQFADDIALLKKFKFEQGQLVFIPIKR
jgi:predicted NAD/FAD-binding protein